MRRHGHCAARLGWAVGLAITYVVVLGVQSPAWARSPYEATFTLGMQGRSGCLVCHSDRNMARLTAGRNISYYINEGVLDRSAHRDISCLACHTDFTYGTPHRKRQSFRVVASLACKNCHRNSYQQYATSAHGKAWVAGKKNAPLCATCHGSHAIASSAKASTLPGSLWAEAAPSASFHLSGMRMCGRCHKKGASSYSDYYHGAAYKNGAADAPACWDCHGNHKVYSIGSKNPNVSEIDLSEACGQCHAGVTKEFLNYTPMIHQTDRIRSENVLWRSIRPVTDWLSSTKDMLMSVVRSLL